MVIVYRPGNNYIAAISCPVHRAGHEMNNNYYTYKTTQQASLQLKNNYTKLLHNGIYTVVRLL